MHRFDERGAATGTRAQFVNVWRWQDKEWRLARILGLDHETIPPADPGRD